MSPDWKKVEAENPGLSIGSAHPIGEGWNARAYLVNEELVFRIPKRADHWEELDREISFLAFGADKLPLPVPRYVLQRRESGACPYGYAVYRYLSGRNMEVAELPVRKRREAAIALAEFLRELHAVQPSPEIDASLPREDARKVAEEEFDRAEHLIAPKLTRKEAVVMQRLFRRYLGTSDNFGFRPAVLHADFSRDHILFDNESVSGIIDFGDICWGDPDYEFMYLFVDYGLAFAKEVARAYGHASIAQLRHKLEYFGIADQIGTILDGEGQAPEGHTNLAWLHLRRLLADG